MVLDDTIEVVNVIKVKNPRMAMYTISVLDDVPSSVPKLKNTIESMMQDLKAVNDLSNREDSMFVYAHSS